MSLPTATKNSSPIFGPLMNDKNLIIEAQVVLYRNNTMLGARPKKFDKRLKQIGVAAGTAQVQKTV